MSNLFHKIKRGLNLEPQATAPAGLQDGDVYHDAVQGLMVRTAGSTLPAGSTYAADGTSMTLTGNVFSVANLGITNAKIATAAAIAMTKLAALTANRAVITDGSGFLTASTVTTTELAYLSGTTGAIQTQLNGKQASNADLTAIAAVVGTGYLQKTAPGVWSLGTPGGGATPGVRMVTIGSTNSDYTTLNLARTAMGFNACIFKLSPETHTLTADVSLNLGQTIQGTGGGTVIDVGNFKITTPTAAAGLGTRYDSTTFAALATGAGTISVTAGSTAATTSIDISATLGNQGWFLINGQRFRVQSVTGTAVTLARPYRGTTDAAADLWIQNYYSEGNQDSYAAINDCVIRTAASGSRAPVEIIGMFFKMNNVRIKCSSMGGFGLVHIHNAAYVELNNVHCYAYSNFASDFSAIGGAAFRMEDCRNVIMTRCSMENMARILVCNNAQTVVNRYCALDFSICENIFNFTGSTQSGLLWDSTLNIDQITGGRGGDYFMNFNGVPGVFRFNQISIGNIFLPGQLLVFSGSAGGGNVGNIYSFGKVQAAVIRMDSSADTGAGRRNTVLSGDIAGSIEADGSILGTVSYTSLSGTPFRNSGGVR